MNECSGRRKKNSLTDRVIKLLGGSINARKKSSLRLNLKSRQLYQE
jgi:hypothetical protein